MVVAIAAAADSENPSLACSEVGRLTLAAKTQRLFSVVTSVLGLAAHSVKGPFRAISPFA